MEMSQESSSQTTPESKYNLRVHQARKTDSETAKILDDYFRDENISPEALLGKLDEATTTSKKSEKTPETVDEPKPEITQHPEPDALVSEVQKRKQLLGGSFFESQPNINHFFEKADRIRLDKTTREIAETLEKNHPKYLILVELERRYREERKEISDQLEKTLHELGPTLEEVEPVDLDRPISDRLIELLTRLEMTQELLAHHPARLELEQYLEQEFGDKTKKTETNTEVSVRIEETPEELSGDTETVVKRQILEKLSQQAGLIEGEVFISKSRFFQELLEIIRKEQASKIQAKQALMGRDLSEAKKAIEEIAYNDILKDNYVMKILAEYNQENIKTFNELAKQQVVPEMETEEMDEDDFLGQNEIRLPRIAPSLHSWIALSEKRHKIKRRKSLIGRVLDVFG